MCVVVGHLLHWWHICFYEHVWFMIMDIYVFGGYCSYICVLCWIYLGTTSLVVYWVENACEKLLADIAYEIEFLWWPLILLCEPFTRLSILLLWIAYSTVWVWQREKFYTNLHKVSTKLFWLLFLQNVLIQGS